MNRHIQELNDEAHEIISNINIAAREGEITAGQRDELIKLVYEDVNAKLQLAMNLLHDWTGKYDPRGNEPLAG